MKCFFASLVILILCLPARAQAILDKIDDSLFLQTASGFLRTDLSGLIDLEADYIDGNPPGLIFPEGHQIFFNPRLTLFLDTKIGEHFYSLVQVRADRGFDPGVMPNGDIRADEYFLRYTPFNDARLNIQVGKFATVFGSWVNRHDSWQNPLINAPLPYENVFGITDQSAPASTAAFLARKAKADTKRTWLTQVWGPSYTSGASVFGTYQKFDYAAEFKNASLASRPSVWDGFDRGWSAPTVTARIGVRPSTEWNVGASVSYGSYMMRNATGLPAGARYRDYAQLAIGEDISYEWHKWQFFGEAIASRFEVPNVGNAETLAYYVEAKYKITPALFVAGRWNQQFFDKIPNPGGPDERWDHDMWRPEIGVGYRFTRHIQSKLQYSYSHQNGAIQQGEQLLAAQVTIKF